MKNRNKTTANAIVLHGHEMIIPLGDLPIHGVLVMRPEPGVYMYWDCQEWVPLAASSWRRKFAAPAPAIPTGSWCVVNRLKLAGGLRFLHNTLNQHAFRLAFRHVDVDEVSRQISLEVSDQGCDGNTERDEIAADVRDYVEDHLASVSE